MSGGLNCGSHFPNLSAPGCSCGASCWHSLRRAIACAFHFMPAPASLPIWKIRDDILRMLPAGNRLVLVAPTGSGKTTQVPQMLLDAGIAGDKMIVVLQPRRVAARTVATRVAWSVIANLAPSSAIKSASTITPASAPASALSPKVFYSAGFKMIAR